MPKYKVKCVRKLISYADIEAKDEEEAKNIADSLTGGGGWNSECFAYEIVIVNKLADDAEVDNDYDPEDN